MPKIDKIEYEKRLRVVQEWIIEDWASVDIIAQIRNKWELQERQAKKYISEARKLWAAQEDAHIDQKRRLKIQSLKKLKRSLKDPFKGTPSGIRAIMAVEKEIIKLEGLNPATKVQLSTEDGKPLVQNNVTYTGPLSPAKIQEIAKALEDEV